MSRRLISLVVLMLSVAGCGSSPASPEPSSPAGTWSGSLSDSGSGNGTVTLTLAEEANGFWGPWTATFPNGTTFSGVAGLNVVASGAYGMTMYADPPPACDTTTGPGASALLGYILINVNITSSKLTAMSTRLNCNGPAGFGSVSLSRK